MPCSDGSGHRRPHETPLAPHGCENAPVFGRDHSNEDLSQRIDHDVVYVGPDGVFDGAEGLSEAFARFRHEES